MCKNVKDSQGKLSFIFKANDGNKNDNEMHDIHIHVQMSHPTLIFEH